jgi:hypothetical protein
MNIRTKSIAITPSLDRWLRWAATVEESTAEAIVNEALTASLLAKYPAIKDIEDAYQVSSSKLWNEAADKLKEGHIYAT